MRNPGRELVAWFIRESQPAFCLFPINLGRSCVRSVAEYSGLPGTQASFRRKSGRTWRIDPGIARDKRSLIASEACLSEALRADAVPARHLSRDSRRCSRADRGQKPLTRGTDGRTRSLGTPTRRMPSQSSMPASLESVTSLRRSKAAATFHRERVARERAVVSDHGVLDRRSRFLDPQVGSGYYAPSIELAGLLGSRTRQSLMRGPWTE